jgi:hypothetical protein
MLNINAYSTQFLSPPNMLQEDQLNLCRKLLVKLIRFLRSVSIRLKEKRSMMLLFEEISVAILVASYVLPYTGAHIFIKIYLRCQDESLWKFLSDLYVYSNNPTLYELYDPVTLKSPRLALERGAIREPSSSYFRDIEASVCSTMFS